VLPKQKIPEFGLSRTSNHKGYTASWAVFDNQLYLIGIVAVLRDSEKLSSNTAVLKNVKFPLQVTNWSGIVTRRDPVSFYDPNTDKMGSYVKVTTLVFKNGKLISSVFDKKEAKAAK